MKKLLIGAMLLVGMSIAGAVAPTVSLTFSVNGTLSPVTPTLIWSSAGASVCTASSSPVDSKWSGAVATSGTLAVGPITAATTYTLTCSNAVNTSANLSWVAPTLNTDGTSLTDLAGFKAYEVIAGSPVLTTTLNNASFTNVNIINLVPGIHTFYVTAFNANGIESSPSNSGSKTILIAESTSKNVVVPVEKKAAPPVLTVR